MLKTCNYLHTRYLINSVAKMPNERIQVVTFIRHGVAKHNLLDPSTGKHPDICDPIYFDPQLVNRGMQDALAVRERLSHTVLSSTELIITSPLTRCLQTANLIFLPGNYATSGNGNDQSSPNTLAPPPPPPIICIEAVREAYGMHYPDKRRDKRLLQQHWPTVQFDPTMTNVDELWSDEHRESCNDVCKRIEQFLQWLVQRPEQHIVVVSHGVWIETLFRTHFPNILRGGQRVYNCDCFQGKVVSSGNGKFERLQEVHKI